MRARGDGRVVLGPRAQPAQIGVDEAHARRPRPRDLGQRQVGADRHLPGVIDGNARGAEEAAGEVALTALEAVAQRDRLGRGHRHSLPVRGVERADRVARDQQPRREAAQAVVAAADAGGEAMGRDLVERLGGLDRVEHVGRRDGGRKRSEPVGVARWTVHGPIAAEPEDPAPVLLGEQEQGARVTRPGADQHELVAVERIGGQGKRPAGVGDADLEALHRGALVAQRLEPGGDASRAAGGGDDQVRRERLLGAAVGTVQDPHAGDPLAVPAGGQPESVAAIDQRDARQLTNAAAHVALDEGPARERRGGARRCAGQLMATDHEAHLLERRAGWRPSRGQLGAEAGQQRVEKRLPVRQEGVGVASLRHRPAALEAGRQGVALDHGHPLVGLRKRPGGQQPGHAPADHDGVLTNASHVRFLLVAVVAQGRPAACRDARRTSAEFLLSCAGPVARFGSGAPRSWWVRPQSASEETR